MERVRALERLKRKITVENLWLYVMRTLELEGRPLKAYDFRRALRERFGINVPTITVYTVVYRMEREGLLRRVREGGETLYEATDKGREAFRRGMEFIREILKALGG
ncbi:MAG: PadR family transcriptional regulator [Desulfurococcaceae archaeon]